MKIAYLLGAGATQGAIDHAGGQLGQLMWHLAPELVKRLVDVIRDSFDNDTRLLRIVNEIDEGTDFEQLITFFDDSPSERLRAVGSQLQQIFQTVLHERLLAIEDEIGDGVLDLFEVLIDMHQVNERESLAGFLTLNYDFFLERAIRNFPSKGVDLGFREDDRTEMVKVLKLHGSFGWKNDWPIDVAETYEDSHWIPPGIRKQKTRYPFNGLWSGALDLLDCDVLRIIGCNLGPNDWDLVSLIFSCKYSHVERPPFQVEVIGSPAGAERIRERFPYLLVRSILETPDVGRSINAELVDRAVPFEQLKADEQRLAIERYGDRNSFLYWLTHKAESVASAAEVDVGNGAFARFVDRFAGY